MLWRYSLSFYGKMNWFQSFLQLTRAECFLFLVIFQATLKFSAQFVGATFSFFIFCLRLNMFDSEEGPVIPNSETANLFRKASRVIRFVKHSMPFILRMELVTDVQRDAAFRA